MTSHLGVMLLFAACVATVFATMSRDEPREQMGVAVKIFGALAVTAYALGWLMYVAFP